MIEITLNGTLGQKYGRDFRASVRDLGDLMRFLFSQMKGFRKDISEGAYRIRVHTKEHVSYVVKGTTGIPFPEGSRVSISPVAFGSKNGTTKIIIGAVIIAATFATLGPSGALVSTGGLLGAGAIVTSSQLLTIGAIMALGGIYQMFIKQPQSPTSDTNAASSNVSSLFNGPSNSARQGVAKPVVFGRFICSTVIISSDIVSERV